MPGGGHSPEFDYDESKPAGSTKGYDADNWIRSNEMHIDNALSIEHYSPSNDPDASEDDFGRHDFITLKEQAVKPSLTSSTNREAIYSKADGIYIELEDGTEIKILDFTSQSMDIPPGEIIVFDKDTAVTGYTLKTDKDDMLLFITKGSVAGGQTGGGDHSTGTWTQPDHVLTISEMPSHRHVLHYGQNAGGGGDHRISGANWSSSGMVEVDNDDCMDTTGGGAAHNHGTTWRPAARCFTRQERN